MFLKKSSFGRLPVQLVLLLVVSTLAFLVFAEIGKTQSPPILKKKNAPQITSRKTPSTPSKRTTGKRGGTKYRTSQGTLDQEPLNVEISKPAPIPPAEFVGDVRNLPQ